MSAVPVAIRADGLGKRYRIGGVQYRTLRDMVDGRVAAWFRRSPPGGGEAATSIWALQDVSFEVRRGEAIGLIGSNGSGKSTLLKVLSRITLPTTGRAEIQGRVGSLLEVGTGFHPDLTGRENIFLSAAILGMRRAQILARFDEIVEFAELARFVDTPVKHYSSGMYMRLAFSVAAHVETEVLLVDEVLAVGDLAFQRKCLGRMDHLAGEGRTLIFVSHNMDAVQRLCSRGILLRQGRIVAQGAMPDVVNEYRRSLPSDATLGRFQTAGRVAHAWAEIHDIRLVGADRRAVGSRATDEDLVFEVDLRVRDASRGTTLRGQAVELVVHAEEGYPIVSLMSVDDQGIELPAAMSCTVRATLAGPTLVPGRYRLFAFLGLPYLEHVDELHDCFEFEITPPREPWRPYPLHPARGRTCRHARWDTVDMPVEYT